MKIFDPHIHMYSRVTDDYERMATAGIEAVLEPSFWLGEPRKYAESFFDYFDYLLGFEAKRAERYGIRHYTAIALNPREANDPKLAARVLDGMQRYLDRPGVVAVGEVGFDELTDAEEEALARQVGMARDRGLPVLVHTPHREKAEGVRRTIEVMRRSGVAPAMTLIDHNNEETTPAVLAYGAWAGHTVYPVTKLSPQRAANIVERHGVERILINSSADWGEADPLMVPKVIRQLKGRGVPQEKIQQLVWDNPAAFFAQSGKMGS